MPHAHGLSNVVDDFVGLIVRGRGRRGRLWCLVTAICNIPWGTRTGGGVLRRRAPPASSTGREIPDELPPRYFTIWSICKIAVEEWAGAAACAERGGDG